MFGRTLLAVIFRQLLDSWEKVLLSMLFFALLSKEKAERDPPVILPFLIGKTSLMAAHVYQNSHFFL